MRFGLVLGNDADIRVFHGTTEWKGKASKQDGSVADVPGKLAAGEWVVDDGTPNDLDVKVTTHGTAYHRNYNREIAEVSGTSLKINPENPPQPPNSKLPPAWMNI